MGNWRTVQIVGGMLGEEVEALKKELYQVMPARFSVALYDDPEFIAQQKKFGPLSYCGGLCGLGNWPDRSINAIGNLAERDYDPQAVAEHLEQLAKVAPSLGVLVHCGDDYEVKDCIATVVLLEGVAIVQPPHVETIGDIPKLQIENNLLRALLGGR